MDLVIHCGSSTLGEYINTLSTTFTIFILVGGGSPVLVWGVRQLQPATKLSRLPSRSIKVVPFVSDEVVYLTADKEDEYTIAQANVQLDDKNQFVDEKVEARLGDRYLTEVPDKIDFMDVSPMQIFSVATSLIPFLEHDDANRALMGSNMQRQAVPLLRSEEP